MGLKDKIYLMGRSHIWRYNPIDRQPSILQKISHHISALGKQTTDKNINNTYK